MNKTDVETVKVPFQELSPVLEACLEQGQEVVLTVTGNSMAPFLRHGRDRVVLVKAADPAALQPGDIPLFRRTNGRFVLHRIVERDDGEYRYRWHNKEILPTAHVGGGIEYTLLGDAQVQREPRIRPEQVVAVAKAFWIKGKLWECDSPRYRRRVRRWHRLLPLREPLIWTWNFAYRIPNIPRRLKREFKKLIGK